MTTTTCALCGTETPPVAGSFAGAESTETYTCAECAPEVELWQPRGNPGDEQSMWRTLELLD